VGDEMEALLETHGDLFDGGDNVGLALLARLLLALQLRVQRGQLTEHVGAELRGAAW